MHGKVKGTHPLPTTQRDAAPGNSTAKSQTIPADMSRDTGQPVGTNAKNKGCPPRANAARPGCNAPGKGGRYIVKGKI